MKKTTEIFFSIQNADAEKRLVSGVSDSGEPNQSGLLLDYKTSKPILQAWSEGIEKKTKGASKGVLRVMHQLENVGKIVSLEFDDEAEKILVTVYVSDDKVWEKVQGGEYTGFSWWWRTQGMPWRDEAATTKYGRPIYRYTGKPIELSIVDAACVPGSDFTEIQNADFPEEENDMDPTETDPKPDETPEVPPVQDIKNGVYTAGRLGECVETLAYIQRAIAAEEGKEGDSAEIPAELKSIVQDLAGAWAKYAAAKAVELAGGADTDMLSISDEDEFSDLDDVKNADAPSFGNSKLAHRATMRAVVSGDSKHHEAAASFHKEAAKVQGRAGKKKMEAYHKGMAKIHSSIKNADGDDIENAEKPDALAALEARLLALETSREVKNAEEPTGADILADLAKQHAPAADVKNADKPDSTLAVVTKDEDNGVNVKNAEEQRKARAERIAALPEAERPAAVLAEMLQGAAR